MLIHEVADEIRCAWWPTRPLAFLIGCDQTRLRLQPGNVGWLIRLPESFNKGAGAREFRIAIDQNQGCIHHTVSASILSYSLWVPKKRGSCPILQGRNQAIVIALDVSAIRRFFESFEI
jgi:hypothetical protein